MSWLDKLMGRGKKAAGDVTGDDSMRREGMHQEQEGMASERAESAEDMAQKERESAAEHHAERTDTPESAITRGFTRAARAALVCV